MTRKEVTGTRDLTFSAWIREKLPDSATGFLVSDLDFILWQYKKRKLMLIEAKSHRAYMRRWQGKLFHILDELIIISHNTIKPPIKYYGFHCIRFENTGFNDGRCMFDGRLVTEKELIDILSMKD